MQFSVFSSQFSVFSSRSLEAFDQSGKHSLYFTHAFLKLSLCGSIQYSKIAGQTQEILDFAGRPHRYMQKLFEFPLASPATSFSDICRNRIDSSPNLRSKSEPFIQWKRAADSVNKQGQGMALLPDAQTFEVLHGCSTVTDFTDN